MTTSLLHTGRRSAVVGTDWTAWGICGRLVVTDPESVAMARAVLGRELGALGGSFRTPRGARSAMRDLGRTPRMPDGRMIGPFPYGVTSVPAGEPIHLSLPALRARADAMPTRLRRGSRVRIGLGPSLRAWTAQRCAESVAEATGCGILIAIGGDVASSGLAPVGGWRVELPGGAGSPPAVLAMDGGAVSWIDLARPGRAPRKLVMETHGRPLRPVWRGVAVVAANTPAANAACSGALLSGPSALRRLADQGLLARLTDADGRVRDVGWWPREQ